MKQYFDNFMEEVEKDLKKNKETYVFTEEQIKYIKEKYKNVEIKETNKIYHIKLIDNIENK